MCDVGVPSLGLLCGVYIHSCTPGVQQFSHGVVFCTAGRGAGVVATDDDICCTAVSICLLFCCEYCLIILSLWRCFSTSSLGRRFSLHIQYTGRSSAPFSLSEALFVCMSSFLCCWCNILPQKPSRVTKARTLGPFPLTGGDHTYGRTAVYALFLSYDSRVTSVLNKICPGAAFDDFRMHIFTRELPVVKLCC